MRGLGRTVLSTVRAMSLYVPSRLTVVPRMSSQYVLPSLNSSRFLSGWDADHDEDDFSDLPFPPQSSSQSSEFVTNETEFYDEEWVEGEELPDSYQVDELNPTNYRQRKIDKYGQSHGVGRRKTAVARVWIKPGVGQVKVNHKDIVEYFHSDERFHALEAFQVTQTAGMFDVWCLVNGGGKMGQAGAIRLGLSRALEAFEPGLKPFLKREKLLTRDSRMVERKKPGLKKARKRKTWVKR